MILDDLLLSTLDAAEDEAAKTVPWQDSQVSGDGAVLVSAETRWAPAMRHETGAGLCKDCAHPCLARTDDVDDAATE